MKLLLRILTVVVVIVLIVVIVIFSMRFYNTKKYGWDKEEAQELHDYDAYEKTFDDGTIEHFESGKSNGFHFKPNNQNDKEPVVVFGGSEGSSNFDLAKQIAEEGYEVYALFFFGAKNQTDTLRKVPLEFFQDFLDYADLDHKNITVIGASKGAELGLLLTKHYDEINNLVLYAPSNYIFMGLDFKEEPASSWTWEGNEYTYIDITQSDPKAYMKMLFDMAVRNPVEYRPTYESAVNMAHEDKYPAQIDTSEFEGKGHALIFAGGDDLMWQSDIAAEEIGHALGDNAEVIIYKNAGHLFGAPPYINGMALGGTKEANIEAKKQSDKKLFQFLDDYSTKNK